MNWTLNKHQLWVVPQFLEPKLLQITRWILWFLANMFKVFMWFINQTNITGGAPPCRIAWRENLQESPLDLPLNQPIDLRKMIFLLCSQWGTKLYTRGIDIGNVVIFWGGFLQQMQVQEMSLKSDDMWNLPPWVPGWLKHGISSHSASLLQDDSVGTQNMYTCAIRTVRHFVCNLGIKIYQPCFLLHDQCKVWHTS